MRTLTALCAVALLAGCAGPKAVLSPISNVPESCAEIDAELIQLATAQGQWQGVGQTKDSLALGISVAAVGGMIPAGFAWAQIAAMVIPAIAVPSQAGRINYLAQAREIRLCEPLDMGE